MLGQVTQRIKQSVAIRADLAFVPRFGARERAGHGFADAFGTVAAFGVPILTAVHRDDVDLPATVADIPSEDSEPPAGKKNRRFVLAPPPEFQMRRRHDRGRISRSML